MLYRLTRMLFTSGEEGSVSWKVSGLEWTLRADDHGYWELATTARLGLELVGLSLAIGEVCGSIILPVLLMSREQPALMRLLPRAALAVAGAPCLIVAACLLSAARGVLDDAVAAALGVALGAVAYSAMWSSIGRPVRSRLLLTLGIGRTRVAASSAGPRARESSDEP